MGSATIVNPAKTLVDLFKTQLTASKVTLNAELKALLIEKKAKELALLKDDKLVPTLIGPLTVIDDRKTVITGQLSMFDNLLLCIDAIYDKIDKTITINT